MIGHGLEYVFHTGSNELENYVSYNKHVHAIVVNSLLENNCSCHVNQECLPLLCIFEGWPTQLIYRHCHLVLVHDHWSYPPHNTTQQ